MAKPVKITVTVQANKLYNGLLTVDQACTLSDDNNGTSSNGTIENFTSNVYIDKNVAWDGKTKNLENVDQGYDIAITSIVYEPDGTDVDFFTDTTINGSNGRNGNVNSNVKNDRDLIGQHDTYTINFSVYPPASSQLPAKSYPIDPKLMGNN